ncbi:CbtB-domain containing protein [Nakamurella silvestris]|nr:CbtB-domain containing protein [Nakamurella silvestris]
MSQAVAGQTLSGTPQLTVPAVPVREIMPWLVFFAVLGMIAVYFVSAEQGATSLFAGTNIHEWVHDGRHLLGFPCH